MQRSLRVALTGAVIVSLASCGGSSDSPDAQAPSQSTKQSKPVVNVTKSGAGVGQTKNALSKGSGTSTVRQGGKTYIVQLREPAVAAYKGGVRGLAATRPAQGEKLDATNPAVVSYRAHLQARQDALLSSVGGAKKLHSYAYTFNGFAAQLTDAQLQKLATAPGVLAISEDTIQKKDTSTTPQFLGLTGRDGFYKEFGAKGENIVIGVIDSGITPELNSFADRKKHGHRFPFHWGHDDHGKDEWSYGRLRGWNGTCQVGEQWTADECSDKLIGARFYTEGFGGAEEIKALFPYEFISARDADGHGTHTSSTAGGNANVPTSGPAAVFGEKISGIAPRARVAMYKICWGRDEDEAGCATSDAVAAIDQAIEDGVDVINYSISGTTNNFLHPVEQAFLRAAEAGVFVAASAGNSGPTASTVAHPSPWITTVAAGTHNRTAVGTLTLGNGTKFTSSSAAPAALRATPLILAADAALPGANVTSARLCFGAADNGTPVLDPAKVAGKVVVCDRGTSALVNKSLAVSEAGGVGMVLANVAGGATTTLSLVHSVPTIHLLAADGDVVRAYGATAGATAALSKGQVSLTVPAPFTASFSSRGPSLAAGGNILKPDVIAPGEDILAGLSPANGGLSFGLLSGTSMASPHVAGLGALLRELHPRWSPMAIKSALMTTGGDVRDGANTLPATIFAQGAGHVRPNNAADPGLVFDSDIEDWLGFLCATAVDPSICTDNGVAVIDPTNLNTASIAISALPGTQTVTRRVTNVTRSHATYTASVTGLEGYNVAVRPRSLTVPPGQTRTFTVQITRTTAPLNTYAGGQITLSGGSSHKWYDRYAVRVPVVVSPVAFQAPAEASGSYQVKFGYTGTFSAAGRGLVPAQQDVGNIVTDGLFTSTVNVAAGTSLARFSLFDAHVTPASDLDLFVFDPEGNLVGLSLSFSSEEEVNIENPVPGEYTVFVSGFDVPGDTGADFTLYSWTLGSGLTGNMTVNAPTAARSGNSGNINLRFTGLQPGTKYLGAIDYSSTDQELVPASTILRVDP